MNKKLLATLRISLGWLLFQGGIVKVLNPEWTAAGYLTKSIPEGNPFAFFWSNIAGSPLIDGLVAWGLTLAGLGLIFGLLTKFSALYGAFLMATFWASSLAGGLLQGYPVGHGWVVDDHVIYVVALLYISLHGSGQMYSLEEKFLTKKIKKKYPILKKLQG